MIKMNKTRALAVARLIGKARRLMNNDGEHWIQGHLTLASSAFGTVRHCAIGGLVHAFLGESSREYATAIVLTPFYRARARRDRLDRAVLRDATVLLAQAITGRTLTRSGEIKMPFGSWNLAAYSADEDETDPQFRMAEDIVVAFNDHDTEWKNPTTWKDVDRLFRRAEARARKIAAS
jgi:hypothetical protein